MILREYLYFITCFIVILKILAQLLLLLKSYDYSAEQQITIVEEYNNYPSISSDQILLPYPL